MEKNTFTHSLEQKTDHYKLVDSMLNGYAINQLILDNKNKPINYRFIEINSAFEYLTGLSKKEIIGKNVLEILPKTEKKWIELCGYVALNQKDICAEYYSPSLKRYFHVRITGKENGTFITIFNDISPYKKIYNELKEQKEFYESMFNNIRIGLIRTNIDDGSIIQANPACADIFGFKDIESFTNSSIVDLYNDPNDRRKHCEKLLKHSGMYNETIQMRSKDNKKLNIFTNSSIHYENDIPVWIDSTFQDVTEQKRAQERLDISSIVFEHTLEAVVISDETHKILTVNKAFTDITGYAKEDVLGKNFNILWSEEIQNDDYCDLILHNVEHNSSWQGEIQKLHKNGHYFPVQLSVIKGSNHYISIFYDITYRKQSEEKLYQLAHFDALTNLSNRHSFLHRLEDSLEKSSRYNYKCAVYFLDLDGFKDINDTYGHKAGDKVLISVANRLKSIIRKSDMVARMGGDEFTIIIDNFSNTRSLNTLGKRIIKSISKDIKLEQNSVNVTVSIGISTYPGDAKDLKSIIAHADKAMYKAKELGKNTLMFFTKEQNIELNKRMILEKELSQALKKDELHLFYQARINSKTDKIIGFDIIVKWNNKSKGWMSAEEFISVAIESNIAYKIFFWAITTSCKHIKEYQQKYNRKLYLSVSIPDKYLNSPNFIKEIKKALLDSKLESSSLYLQVQQHTLIQSKSLTHLKNLQKIGVKIIIDNFGKGVSSIHDLEKIEISGVKIDKSFIVDLHKKRPSKALLSLIDIAKNFQTQIIADAIGSKVHLFILKDLQVDQVQGVYLYPQTDSEQIHALLIKNT